MAEEILDPDLPIVDPHHHLWDRRNYAPPATAGAAETPEHPFITAIADARRYLLDELIADTSSGHNVRATVFVECGAMYKAEGPADFRCIGETEFVNGVAAMSASGTYGDFRACAGIVSKADLLLGDSVKPVLEAHVRAGGGRFKGIRNSASFDQDKAVLGPLNRVEEGLYLSDQFRSGFKHLAHMGLSFDAWLLEPQLPDVISLARAFPETTIVLDHVGTPLGRGDYEGMLPARFGVWRDNIRELAKSPNVVVKLGGLAMAFCNFPSFLAEPRAPSLQLATEWAPYIGTCIEAFGAERCMFESNFPVDMGTCDYATLWNAFKHIAKGAGAAEKTALFSGTATKVYRLEI
ncbi:amidohydrolase family protein [Phenylobacterium sp.]|jgi:predicted TIM-barrel fold metal-dependent hydrolase|uniref:amidohydrolase family protein n=1 Tax=Phenylobacterium sp. TaxID=1871053 RepID=UPI002E35974F|nr:amidohydrolase family protein [Phenylobacterium sp.]HEX3366684.1 amidohydrolase family protein [Phenylobacterium sp.]